MKRVIGAVKPAQLKAELDPIWQDKVDEWGNQAFADLGLKPRFDMFNENVKTHLEDFAGERIENINDTTQEALGDTLGAGIAAGEGYEELAARVAKVFEDASDARAENIARTETCRSANFATLEGYKQTGLIEKKQWIATNDDRVRPEHLELGMMDPIPLDEPFRVGGWEADHPGDFDDPEMDCNCRCAVSPYVDELPVDPEEIDDGKAAPRGVSKVPSTAERWKTFDSRLAKWDKVAIAAVRKAFDKQKAAALAALRA